MLKKQLLLTLFVTIYFAMNKNEIGDECLVNIGKTRKIN
jgi:hypothetical protein